MTVPSGKGARSCSSISMVGSDQHEGGARQHDLTLRLWRSRDRRIVDLGTYDDTASLAAGARSAPFVLVAERMHPDGSPERRYRCVSAAGAVERLVARMPPGASAAMLARIDAEAASVSHR